MISGSGAGVGGAASVGAIVGAAVGGGMVGSTTRASVGVGGSAIADASGVAVGSTAEAVGAAGLVGAVLVDESGELGAVGSLRRVGCGREISVVGASGTSCVAVGSAVEVRSIVAVGSPVRTSISRAVRGVGMRGASARDPHASSRSTGIPNRTRGHISDVRPCYISALGTCAFRRREEDEYREVFGDGVKLMVDARRDEDECTGLHRTVLASYSNSATPTNDVVDFILSVRLLRILRAGRQEIQARGQRGNAKKLLVRHAIRRRLLGELGKIKALHCVPLWLDRRQTTNDQYPIVEQDYEGTNEHKRL